MPARKLSQSDLDSLKAAYDELRHASNPKSIVRSDGLGNKEIAGWEGPKELTTNAQIAAWRGISESHLYASERKNWKLKRGAPRGEHFDDGETVPAAVLRTTFDMLQERIESQARRIAELETQLREKNQ